MLFTKDKSFYKRLILLSIPIALQNLITFCVNLADGVMVGALGDAAVSGLYMGNQIQTLLQVLNAGIEGAMLVLAAQYWGKRDTASIHKIVAIGIRFSLGVGIILTLICSLFSTDVIGLFTKDAVTVAAGAEYLSIVCLSYWRIII